MAMRPGLRARDGNRSVWGRVTGPPELESLKLGGRAAFGMVVEEGEVMDQETGGVQGPK